MESKKEMALQLFQQGYNCSQAVFTAYCDHYGIDKETALKLSCSFGGGMGRMREVCGAVSGMFMIAGLETGYTDSKAVMEKKNNYDVVQELGAEFKNRFGSLICRDLLGLAENADVSDTMPEERTPRYYKKRPCERFVEGAAEIIEEKLYKNH